jgi:hypothetical protein
MAPRTLTMVVGLAFLLCGLLIMLLPMSAEAPSGSTVACGNSLGMGFDALAVERRDPAFVDICGRLRSERMVWAAPVAILGVVLLAVGGLVGRRRSAA